MNSNISDPTLLIVSGVVGIVVVLAIVWVVARQRNRQRTAELRARFGSEYDLALREHGSRPKAEAALLGRVNRVQHMSLHALTMEERDRFLADWETVQSRFIDHPRGAVTEADDMINKILQARGYEGGAFEQRTADISVHHANLVEPYRRAYAVSARAGRNEATTEELRSAMILYRALIDELLQASEPAVHRQAA
jgi:hypothetical protein